MSLCVDDRLVGEFLYQYDTWFMSLCVDDRLVGEFLYQYNIWFMSLWNKWIF